MFEIDVESEAAQIHALAGRLAACVDSDVCGAVADQALEEALAASRQLDLLVCRLIERVDRSGQFCVDGVASTTAFVRRKVNERGEWASKRVAVGRALADRLPMSGKGWEAGRLGLEHASVIDHATRQLEDPQLVAEFGSCPKRLPTAWTRRT